MDAETLTAVTVLCGTPLLLLFVILLLWWRLHNAHRTIEQLESEIEQSLVEMRNEKARMERYFLERLGAQFVEMRKWLEEVANANYKSELEVEVKFVYPLLRMLGYPNEALDIRVPVFIPIGRQEVRGEADWVVHCDGKTIVVEAKRPEQPLDESVVQQAKSYAFALNALYYVVTNGLELKVYQRSVPHDECVFSCRVSELRNRWPELVQLIGNQKALKAFPDGYR